MKSETKVSVVIPIYKVEKYLHQCIDSVINQTLTDIQIILVDDGSPDRCGEIIEEYKNKDNRVLCVHKENGGVSAARNDGIRLCHGEYLYIMDSDDYLELSALEKMYNNAKKNNVDIVISDHYTFYESKPEQENHFFSKEFSTHDKEIIDAIISMTLFPSYSPFLTDENKGLGIAAPWTKIIRRSIVEDNDLQFDSGVKGIFDDGLFTLQVFQNAKSISYIRDCIYHYRVLQNSLIHKYNPNRNQIDRIIFEKIRGIGENYNKNGDYWKAFFARIIMFTSIEIGTYIANKKNKMSIIQKTKLLKEIVQSEPYNDAFRKVETKKIQRRYQLLVSMIRKKMYFAVIILYCIYK